MHLNCLFLKSSEAFSVSLVHFKSWLPKIYYTCNSNIVFAHGHNFQITRWHTTSESHQSTPERLKANSPHNLPYSKAFLNFLGDAEFNASTRWFFTVFHTMRPLIKKRKMLLFTPTVPSVHLWNKLILDHISSRESDKAMNWWIFPYLCWDVFSEIYQNRFQ